ncbi:MAG: copper resistance protein CopC [Anaerolineales bacterium]|nr:copper resistance protein CopC [Anaerolineales bacterium]
MKIYRRFFVAILIAAIWVTAVTHSASAHAYLLRSDPATGSILAEPPTDVNLWFDEPIAARFSAIKVFDINSRPVPVADIRTNPNDPYHLAFSFPEELETGVYTILWETVSEADGHFSLGMIVFGVGEDVDLNAATLEVNNAPPPPPAEAGLRWVNFTLLATLVGAIVVAHRVIRPTKVEAELRPLLQKAQQRMVNLASWSAILLLVVGFALLAWQVQQLMQSLLTGVTPFDAVRQIVATTRWGLFWNGRQLLLLLIIVSLFSLRRFPLVHIPPRIRIAWGIAGMLLITLLVVQSSMGHASAAVPNTAVSIAADALHLLAAAIWVGGLIALAFGIIPMIRQERSAMTALIKAGWQPFGGIAALSVGILFATGLYNTGQQVASVDALITTFYGQALLVKILLVIGIGVVGLMNSMLLHPRLAARIRQLLNRPEGWLPVTLQQLPRLVLIELSIGLVVLLLTGLMTASPTPRGIEYTVSSEDVPDALSEKVGDMVITLTANPNTPGQNVFTVFAASSRRPAPAEILRVILRFTYLEQDLGRVTVDAEEVEPGRFLLTGNYLSLVGPWQVEVAVRRAGMEDSVATFDWVVAPPGSAQPEIVSKKPMKTALIYSSGILLTAVLITALVVTVSNRKRLFATNHRFSFFRRKNKQTSLQTSSHQKEVEESII